jgi:hypothetical protein
MAFLILGMKVISAKIRCVGWAEKLAPGIGHVRMVHQPRWGVKKFLSAEIILLHETSTGEHEAHLAA